jgi:predicted nucleic acid-binding Zn ribbon protein
LSATHCVNHNRRAPAMNAIIYLVGLVVVVMAVLSFVGLH